MKYKVLILIVLITGLSIIGASIYIGIDKRDAEVEENAYDTGIKFDETLKRQAELGWRIEIPHTFKSGDNQIMVGVFDKNGSSIKDAFVELQFNRLGSADIKKYRCNGNGNGQYTAVVKLDNSGYWDVRANVAHLKDSMRFDDKVYVQ